MGSDKQRAAELAMKYAQLDPKPPMPSGISAFDSATGKMYRNTRRGLGDPMPFSLCVAAWEGLLASAEITALREQLRVAREGLEAVINHQKTIGGSLSPMSATVGIAATTLARIDAMKEKPNA